MPVSITLTNPSLGNSWQLDFKVTSRLSIGGELRTVRDAQWPVLEKLNFQFENLSEATKNTLYNQFFAAIGDQITLTDFEANVWIGCIDGDVIVSDNRKDGCGWSINFNFEGILQ